MQTFTALIFSNIQRCVIAELGTRFLAEVERSVTSAKNASGLARTEAQTTDAGSVRKDDACIVRVGIKPMNANYKWLHYKS